MRCGGEGCKLHWNHLTKLEAAEVAEMDSFAWWSGKGRIAGKFL